MTAAPLAAPPPPAPLSSPPPLAPPAPPPPPQNILVPSQGTSVQNIDGSAPPSTPRSVVEADVAAHAEQLIREVMAEKASARDATRAHLVVDVAPTQADAQTQVNAVAGQG